MKTRRAFALMLVIAMTVSIYSINAVAYNQNTTSTTSSSSEYTLVTEEFSDSSDISNKVVEFPVEIALGESVEIELTDGTIVGVTCIDETISPMTRAGTKTSTRRYTLSVSGLKACDVEYTFTYYENGVNGYAITLSGTISNVSNGFSPKWDTKNYFTSTWAHGLYLDVTSSASFYVCASYNPYDANFNIAPVATINWSSSWLS